MPATKYVSSKAQQVMQAMQELADNNSDEFGAICKAFAAQGLDGAPVTAQTDPLTGGVDLLADGEAIRLASVFPDDMRSVAQTFTTKAALFVSTALVVTANQVVYKARIASADLAVPAGWTTDAAGYAAGVKTINTAAGGAGAIYRGDIIRVGASAETYLNQTNDSDLSNVGTVSLGGYGLAAAIPASTTALSLVSRGEKIYGAINCDNAVEAAIACQDPKQRDFELTLGEAIIIESTAPISNIWFTCANGIAINAHRLDIQFGA